MKDLDSIDWENISASLNKKGFAHIPAVLNKEECDQLIHLYSRPLYRSVINMQRYRVGQGEYKYFNYPLPKIIQSLREQFYPRLTPVANQWSELLAIEAKHPATHNE